MKRLNRIQAALVVALISGGALRAEEKPVFPQFVRPLGMGGAFTAVADDDNVFSYNPAGMVQRTGAELTIFQLAVGASQDTDTVYKFVSDHKTEFDNLKNLSQQDAQKLYDEINDQMIGLTPRLTAAADAASFVSGPKFLGIPVHGGFGLLGAADGQMTFNPGSPVPSISYQANADLLVPFSLAKRFTPRIIPGTLGVGLTGKFISREEVAQKDVSLAQLDNIHLPPAAKGKGLGSDLGFLYQPTKRTSLGVMVQDFLGTKLSFDATDAKDGFPAVEKHDSVIRPRTNIGIALVPDKLLWLLPTGNRLTLAADVRDLTAKDQHIFFQDGLSRPFGEDLWTHVFLGAEYRWWFLRFRGGAYQGYPSFGLGLDLPFLKLDYAFYSQELGARAGDLRQGMNMISIAFKFGTGYTEARERIRNKKGSAQDEADTAVPPSSEPAQSTTAPAAASPATPAATPAASPSATPTPSSTPAPAATPAPKTKGK